jgi:hypothetical protein
MELFDRTDQVTPAPRLSRRTNASMLLLITAFFSQSPNTYL